MIWFSSGDGYIKVRNPTNTAWANIGTIGPPMKWTNVDIPSTAWKTGDVKPSFAADEAGWVIANDGTIGTSGTGATCRANPDCAALFTLFWQALGLPLYVGGTWTPVGRGVNATADFAAGRHLQIPKVLGRAMSGAGQGTGLALRYWCWWDGDEYITLNDTQIPGHYHTFAVPDHGHPYCVDVAAQNSYNSTGAGGFATGGNQKVVTGAWNGAPDAATDGKIIGGGGGFAGTTGWSGGNQPHSNVGPRFYCNFLIKL
jgi:microcystin-dependent protein